MTRRGLLILLTTIVALPATALVFLGIRLLQQDRELERQRRAEILQDASDRAVNALEREISAITLRMADASWSTAKPARAAVHLVATRDDVSIEPAEAVAYWPANAQLEPVPLEPFRDVDAMELERQALARALEINIRFAASSNDAVRAGGLMRQARLLRKVGRVDDALRVYGALAEITSVAINGLPADLQARKTRCALLAERSRTADLHREAAAVDSDLATGRWRLDRQNYEYVDALLGEWLGRKRRPRDEHRLTMSAAAEWIYQRWAKADDRGRVMSGAHLLPGTSPATIVWRSSTERLTAVIVSGAGVDQEWLAKAERAAAPATIALVTSDPRPPRSASSTETLVLTRSAAETGLPWSVIVALSNGVGTAEFESRRRTLFAALAAVLALVAAGSYVILRARSREMTLARLQSDFVTAVSHEFRTPLTALLQFNDLLDESANLPIQKRRSYCQAQRRATERLHRLVESLLDFGRMEAGRRQYALERLDAGVLVRDVVDEFRDELEGRGIMLRFATDNGEHHVDADPEALARALWNLLDNAVKYSGDGREVDVSVTCVTDGIAIAVRDRGLGIPGDEQTRIFQKFTRGTAATTRRIRGTGVGLAMVHHIVTGHRGTLKVDSVEGDGSTFTIVLPKASGPLAASEAPEALEAP